MDELKLKPCPFCGHEPELVETGLVALDGSCGFCVACDGDFHHARLIK